MNLYADFKATKIVKLRPWKIWSQITSKRFIIFYLFNSNSKLFWILFMSEFIELLQYTQNESLKLILSH